MVYVRCIEALSSPRRNQEHFVGIHPVFNVDVVVNVDVDAIVVVVERSVIRSPGRLAYSVHHLTSLNTSIFYKSYILFCRNIPDHRTKGQFGDGTYLTRAIDEFLKLNSQSFHRLTSL